MDVERRHAAISNQELDGLVQINLQRQNRLPKAATPTCIKKIAVMSNVSVGVGNARLAREEDEVIEFKRA